MACPFAFSALAALIFLAWVRRKLPKVIYHTPMHNMNCKRWIENPNSLPVLPYPAGPTTRKHYAARYAVGCHLLSSDFRFPPHYTLLSLQHCDAFSTRKEHHDQSTDTRSGGGSLDHSKKCCAHHHRLSAASSELDRLDGSSHVGREHRGHSQTGE